MPPGVRGAGRPIDARRRAGRGRRARPHQPSGLLVRGRDGLRLMRVMWLVPLACTGSSMGGACGGRQLAWVRGWPESDGKRAGGRRRARLFPDMSPAPTDGCTFLVPRSLLSRPPSPSVLLFLSVPGGPPRCTSRNSARPGSARSRSRARSRARRRAAARRGGRSGEGTTRLRRPGRPRGASVRARRRGACASALVDSEDRAERGPGPAEGGGLGASFGLRNGERGPRHSLC